MKKIICVHLLLGLGLISCKETEVVVSPNATDETKVLIKFLAEASRVSIDDIYVDWSDSTFNFKGYHTKEKISIIKHFYELKQQENH